MWVIESLTGRVLFGRIAPSNTAIESQLAGGGNPKVKSQGSWAHHPEILQSQTRCCAENLFVFNRLAVVHGRLSNMDNIERPEESPLTYKFL